MWEEQDNAREETGTNTELSFLLKARVNPSLPPGYVTNPLLLMTFNFNYIYYKTTSTGTFNSAAENRTEVVGEDRNNVLREKFLRTRLVLSDLKNTTDMTNGLVLN